MRSGPAEYDSVMNPLCAPRRRAASVDLSCPDNDEGKRGKPDSVVGVGFLGAGIEFAGKPLATGALHGQPLLDRVRDALSRPREQHERQRHREHQREQRCDEARCRPSSTRIPHSAKNSPNRSTV